MKSRTQYIIVCFFIITLFSSITYSQNQNRKFNTLYLELGGNNIYYSINYERRINENISPRFGFTMIPDKYISTTGKGDNTNILFSFMTNCFIDIDKSNEFEIGGGILYCFEKIFPTLALGYRYQPFDGKMMYKITFTPLLAQDEFDVFLWFGIGIGIRF